MTKREAAIVSAYTGYMCGNFADMHQYVEELLGHPIWTHEFANKEMKDLIQEKSKPDFVAMTITD